MPSSYAPWKQDLRRSNALLFVMPAVIAALAYAVRDHYGVLATLMLVSVMVGWRLRSRVRARQHGQAVERVQSDRAVRQLTQMGFQVEAGRMTCHGDIDLVVRLDDLTATVEIKSYRYWRSRWRDRSRQQSARAQARRQRAAARAQACVIWLPHAWPTWLTRLLNTLLPERDPLVVTGNARRLGLTLRSALGR